MKYEGFTRNELIAHIELLEKTINARDNAIISLNNTIKDLTEKVIDRDKRIKKYKKTITDNENNLSLKNDRIQELEMTVKDIKAKRDAARNANCNSGRYPWGPKPGRLSDQINLIEERLNALENYIFGGNKND